MQIKERFVQHIREEYGTSDAHCENSAEESTDLGLEYGATGVICTVSVENQTVKVSDISMR